MVEFTVDFDEIRERVTDSIFAGAGYVANFVDDLIDRAEELYDQLPDAE